MHKFLTQRQYFMYYHVSINKLSAGQVIFFFFPEEPSERQGARAIHTIKE